MGMNKVSEGGVKYTRLGYRCNRCQFNFRFDLTSRDFYCPHCRLVICDKMAYYYCRAVRAAGAALVLTLLPLVILMFFQQSPLLQAGIPAFAILFGILLFKQMWSLLMVRALLRVGLILLFVALFFMLVASALDWLRIYLYHSVVVVALTLVASLALTMASLAVFGISRDTCEHPASL